jgi:predicted nucleic acid-binding protein
LADYNRLRKILDAGESAAVALAIEKGLGVMIDEEAGRQICAREGVAFMSLADVITNLKLNRQLSEKRYASLRSALMLAGVYLP